MKPIKESYSDQFGEKKIEGYDPTRKSGEEGFYTREQVNAMSDEQLRDPATLKKVNESMGKWTK